MIRITITIKNYRALNPEPRTLNPNPKPRTFHSMEKMFPQYGKTDYNPLQ